MNQQLERAQQIVAAHMEEIVACFKPGVRITVLVRTPDRPAGERDFLMTDDDLGDAIKAIEIRRTSMPGAEVATEAAKAALHNEIVAQIVKSIVVPPLAAGGDYKAVLVILESVVAGVLLAMVKLGGDNIVLDTLLGACRARVQEITARERLGSIDAAGRA